MDELSVDAGIEHQKCDSDVGHIYGELAQDSTRQTSADWCLQAEETGFSQFHLYVCAAFLVKWSEQLMKMNFQEILMFLQALPTREWTEKDIELLLSEAFIWQSLFRGSRAHLRTSNSTIPMGLLGPSG